MRPRCGKRTSVRITTAAIRAVAQCPPQKQWTVGSWIQLGGMGVLIIGTAIYNGSIKVPGLKRETLLAAASPMATSALSRSPLLSRDPIFTPTSPYASGSREPFADAMALGRSNLHEGLIGAAQR